MKLELKDYQEKAATEILAGLRKGSRDYAEDGELSAVSLSAPTGAGKTVIAAAVIERVLFGDPEGEAAGDPDAVFLWLTDDPSLNEQTRKKLLEASDRIQPGNLITLDEGFDAPEFEKGKVYFLNIQKMAKTSNLVVKKEGRRTNVLWDTISRTIKNDGAHYYLVIDEAHRGARNKSKDEQTIAQRLINGDDGVKAAPVVLGISATPERFDAAVQASANGRVLRKVPVSVAAVRESGLIKDVLSISYRGEAQTMEATLVRQAVANLREMDAAWNAYTEAEEEPPVRPALVMQLPPSVSDSDVATLLDVCIDEWDVLAGRNAIAHSLESHTAQEFGRHTVMYVKPQDIQDHRTVRLVLFKERLATGWDCPRAEVMVSLRNAQDDTYIAQVIGRMLRSPLARRIVSDDSLNRVRLYLPNFDRSAVEAVKERLESDDGGLPTDIEINAVDAPRNSHVPAGAFAAIEALTSYQVPGPIHRSQVARLHKMAALLAGDGLLNNAIKVSDAFLISIIETERARLAADGSLEALVKDANTATVEVLDIHATGETTTTVEEFDTDLGDLDRLFAGARRRFRDGLAEKYWGHRVTQDGDDPADAKALTIALASEPSVVEKVESEAADRVRQLFDTHGDAISALSEDKKAKYAEVRAMAREPETVNPTLPTGPITMPGDESVPGYEKHLYSDKAGIYRCRLGVWEQHAYAVEAARDGFVAWYRNPTGGARALRVPYKTNSNSGWGKMYPDFIVIHADDDGTLRPSIIDPHGHHLADAGDKLRGLAAYADKHGAEYARIIGVIKTADGTYRMLDLKDATIRAAIKDASGQEAIEQVFTQHGATYA